MADLKTVDSPSRSPRVAPLHRTLPGLLRDPLRELVSIADAAPDEVVRLNLGPVRPYLVTEPSHVQRVLRDNAANYSRGGQGLLWRPVRRFTGDGILSDGPEWQASRARMQPYFTAKRIDSLVDTMSRAVSDAIDEFEEPARTGQWLDAGAEFGRVICRAISSVFFADRVTIADQMRIVAAQDAIVKALSARLLLPFVPDAFPLPGDRAFRCAVGMIDDIMLPLVRAERDQPRDDDDLLAALTRARDDDGRPLDERRIRDDVVSMFATATETTYALLTWLLPVLDTHPEVAERLYAELEEVVVPGEVVTREQLGRLTYTRLVLDELLRMYPPGWLLPRSAVADDEIGGTRIKAGSTVIVSSYISQRLARYWERPNDFDPERFRDAQHRRNHRYAYFPFGGGPHQCIGMYLFNLEAPLVVATLLSRYRFRLRQPGVPPVHLTVNLRPGRTVEVALTPLPRRGQA
ncbi:cytochrome P450 [Micromonospora globispora]|uniref:Cytochrome P450 n=1 Tax=Micromonospora globispora TaxID=1450148 RepID=A0A317JTB3_9ACTN|nr:cytochrome P450 [Micromonospora globispora]PWU44021.1 cytochrome P450 [Micromonospora globispora]PWU62014.1 cytochrome P450 [Micromonospora globispora]RQW85728.1 cytochrome P450 [Micromonospora globispora]